MIVRRYPIIASSLAIAAYLVSGYSYLAYLAILLLSYSISPGGKRSVFVTISALPIALLNPLVATFIALGSALPHISTSYRLHKLSSKAIELYMRRPPGSYFYKRNLPTKAIYTNLFFDLSLLLIALSPLLIWLLPLSLLPLSISISICFKKEGEDEGPFLPLFGWISASSGSGGVESGLEDTGKGLLFPYLYRLRLNFFKLRTYLKKDPLTSIRELVKKGRLAEFLEGYHSVALRGGDLSSYLKEETKYMLEETYSSWSSRAGGISTIGEVLFITLGFLPNLIILSSFLGFGFFPFEQLALFLPPVYAIVISIADVFLPPSNFKLDFLTPLALSLSLASISTLALSPVSPRSLCLVALISTIPTSVYFTIAWLKSIKEEKFITALLRKAIDGLKSGQTLYSVMMEKNGPSCLTPWRAMVSSGVSPTVAAERIRWTSVTASRAFYSLCLALEKGSGLEAIEVLYHFFKKMRALKRRLQMEVAWVSFFALATPFISSMALGFLADITSNRELLILSSYILLENSILSGILTSKLTSFTLKAAPFLTATLLSCFISMALFGLP